MFKIYVPALLSPPPLPPLPPPPTPSPTSILCVLI